MYCMGGIIVIADTHFGMKKGNINMSMPGYVADFLTWIKSLEDEPTTVKIVEGPLEKKTIRDKNLYNPDKIIFLGDIIELWDSENEPVAACVLSILPTLSEIKAEKIYVLGNHDNTLKRIVLLTPQGTYMNYQLGKSVVKVFPNMYPPPSKDEIVAESCGNEKYLFVHGHQFDKYFREWGASYKVWSTVRNISDSLTLFVPFLFVLGLGVLVMNQVAHTSIFLGENPTLGLLCLLTLPRIYMAYGKRLWDLAVGTRYKETQTIANFVRWWERCTKSRKVPQHLNVVYGHTHYLNYIPTPNHKRMDEMLKSRLHEKYKKELKKREIPERETPTLVNISAWVTDFYVFSDKILLNLEKVSNAAKRPFKKRKSDRLNPDLMTAATFLYIDEDGVEFFGWNWYTDVKDGQQKIFHIPKPAIMLRRKKGIVTDDKTIRDVLKELGWPQKLIELWARDPHLQ